MSMFVFFLGGVDFFFVLGSSSEFLFGDHHGVQVLDGVQGFEELTIDGQHLHVGGDHSLVKDGGLQGREISGHGYDLFANGGLDKDLH